MPIEKRKREDKALLNPFEIDDDDDDDDDDRDDYSEYSTNEDYEDDNSRYNNCSWPKSRSLMVFCLVLILLAMAYSFHVKSGDDDKDFFIPNLPYEWKSDGPHDICEPGNYFNKVLEETKSRTEPECPQLCSNPSEYCLCSNPTIPAPRPYKTDEWNARFTKTKEIAESASKQFANSNDLQVVLLGDSITEHWAGTAGGHIRKEYEEHARIFRRLFTKRYGGKINGVALGVAADTVPQLLYRNQNGGLSDLHPSIFWVLIGTNDLARDGCSVESIVAGNIAIVEDLRRQRPDTDAIVLNSLLPRQEIFMPRISEINERLECYADTTPGVEFFNATGIFWEPVNATIRGLPDQVHPNAESSMVWGTAIVQKVQELIRRANGRYASRKNDSERDRTRRRN